MLPAPNLLVPSLPAKFSTWYPGQEEIFSRISRWLLDPDSRFLCAAIPTGFGKSLLATLPSLLSRYKTVYMTSTIGLQEQLLRDFKSAGMVDIRGQGRYQCIQFPKLNVEQAPCHHGYICSKFLSCLYYSQLDEAKSSPLVITNYAYWLAQSNYSDGFTPIKKAMPYLAIMDEAHQADRALESFLKVEFAPQELSEFEEGWAEWSWAEWQAGCSNVLPRTEDEENTITKEIIEIFKVGGDAPPILSNRLTYLKRLNHKLKSISTSLVEWIQESSVTVSFTPKWVRNYNRSLFLTVPKIILMSAFLTPKTIETLGVDPKAVTWIEAPDPFDSRNTPITHVETTRVDFKTPPENMRHWARRIDDIIRGRQDRKGIVFTVSYARAEMLRDMSEFQGQMYTHKPWDVVRVVEQFKKASAPAVLVSPTVTTGWDFPGDTCEYIVVGKVPQPDSTGEVLKARRAEDSDWPSYLAMQTLVQEAGRGTRSERDRCEVLVVDDHFKWFWPKFKHFAPGWFQNRYTGSVGTIPRALERG